MMDFDDLTPADAYLHARWLAGRFIKMISNLESLEAYEHAYQTKQRFVEGEPIIAKSTGCSYLYAYVILQGRFELGEAAIADCPKTAYAYARHVLHAPFPLGESTIATNGWYSFRYAKYVLEGRFKLGEPAIAQSIWITGYSQIFNCHLVPNWEKEGF